MRFHIVLSFAAALAACKQGERAPKAEMPTAPAPPPAPAPAVAVATPSTPILVGSNVGAFDLAAGSYDLAALFPDAVIEYSPTHATVLGRDRKPIARLTTNGDFVIEIVVYGSESIASFAAAHPTSTCIDSEGEVRCNTEHFPHVFVLDPGARIDAPLPDGTPIAKVRATSIVRAEVMPRGGSARIVRPSKYAGAVVDRCARLVARTSSCGYSYDAEYGWSKTQVAAMSDAEAKQRCDVAKPADGAQPTLPAPDAEEAVVAAIDRATAKGCKALVAELSKHFPVSDKAPWE